MWCSLIQDSRGLSCRTLSFREVAEADGFVLNRVGRLMFFPLEAAGVWPEGSPNFCSNRFGGGMCNSFVKRAFRWCLDNRNDNWSMFERVAEFAWGFSCARKMSVQIQGLIISVFWAKPVNGGNIWGLSLKSNDWQKKTWFLKTNDFWKLSLSQYRVNGRVWLSGIESDSRNAVHEKNDLEKRQAPQ